MQSVREEPHEKCAPSFRAVPHGLRARRRLVFGGPAVSRALAGPGADGPPRAAAGTPPLSRVGFLKVVMIPMFLPSRMSLAPPPSKVSGRQGHRQVWQEGSMLLQRRDSRPGLWYQASYRQRCLIEQGHQDEG